MRKAIALFASAALFAALPSFAEEKPKPPSTPSEFIAAAKAEEWVAIHPNDLLVMQLAPDAKGKARRVVIQLMPAPFSQGWVGNIRKLASAHWWDGTSVNRVQDNYVVQWGDATEKKELPKDLAMVPENEYVSSFTWGPQIMTHHGGFAPTWLPIVTLDSARTKASPKARFEEYAKQTGFSSGWPIAGDFPEKKRDRSKFAWPVHCYGMVGVGRGLSPDTGTGAELYTVIGHAPRHLDRNIAVVGRVIEGIEHLSSLPRGTGTLGFYETEAERVPIASIRLASEIESNADLKFQYLSTESASFTGYANARANRKDDFFIKPAGGADICNIPVPVRRAK